MITLYNDDCRDRLKLLASNSLDSCVTDAPYELGFMNKRWDASGIAYQVDLWAEVLRVLKPGAHLLAFGGTRTYHRLACAIEDAGFEIRDSIHYMYGSGFPKSLDVSKAIDTKLGVERPRTVEPNKRITLHGDRPWMNDPDHKFQSQEPITNEAEYWHGFGTALKPAHEIICLARKPLSESNVAANVLRWGTGALNIDGSRIGVNHWTKKDGERSGSTSGHLQQIANREAGVTRESNQGRWPANVILAHDPNCDGACVVGCPMMELDRQSGEVGGGFGISGGDPEGKGIYGKSFPRGNRQTVGFGDSGGASRFYYIAEWSDDDLIPFFYCAKAARAEREQGLKNHALKTRNRVNPGGLEHDPKWGPIQARNIHPTVKPVSLMEYLIRLVTPPRGTTLDCFLGSGSSGIGALRGGFQFVGIEKDAEYFYIAQGRLSEVQIGLSLA